MEFEPQDAAVLTVYELGGEGLLFEVKEIEPVDECFAADFAKRLRRDRWRAGNRLLGIDGGRWTLRQLRGKHGSSSGPK